MHNLIVYKVGIEPVVCMSVSSSYSGLTHKTVIYPGQLKMLSSVSRADIK